MNILEVVGEDVQLLMRLNGLVLSGFGILDLDYRLMGISDWTPNLILRYFLLFG